MNQEKIWIIIILRTIKNFQKIWYRKLESRIVENLFFTFKLRLLSNEKDVRFNKVFVILPIKKLPSVLEWKHDEGLLMLYHDIPGKMYKRKLHS